MPGSTLRQDSAQHIESLRQELAAIVCEQGSAPNPTGAELSALPTAPPTNSMDGKKKALCHVSLAAAYPLLSVLDICSMGSTEGITRKHLWHLFSLDTLNSYLARDPTAKELTYKVPTRHR